MITLTFEFENEVEAYDMLIVARSKGVSVIEAKKDNGVIDIQEGGFLKQKPLARIIPVKEALTEKVKKITNKHIKK